MEGKCCWCSLPHGVWFKLSLLGILLSFILAVVSIFPPFNSPVATLPAVLVISLLILILSLMLYYSVRDKFWVEVSEKYKKK